MNRFSMLLLVCFTQLMVSCKTKSDRKLFTQMLPAETYIDFTNALEENREYNIFSYEYLYNGGGVAAGDFNNDGLPDLFFTGNQVPNKLYLNRGDLRFEDVTLKAGIQGRKGWRTGVTVADVNGDALLDIYVCFSGPGPAETRANQLFINNGGDIPTFTDRAKEYNLDATGTYSTQASFFDYDRDGDLDMFLLNHAKITYSPFYNTRTLRNKRHPYFGNRLYRNDDSVFKDVSAEAGIHGSGINFGLGVAVSDINSDGWPDLYVTNDYEEQDFFYLNRGNGTFRECAKESFRHISRFGMGVDVADFNNDALQDVFVVDMLPEDGYRQKLLKGPDEFDKYSLLRDSGYHHQNMRNTLQLNTGYVEDGVPAFSEVGRLAGVSGTDWSWCPLFVDIDNDGWKDLFVTNGYLRDYTNLDFLKYTFEDYKKKAAEKKLPLDTLALIREMPSTRVSNYAFRNNGNLQFKNTTVEWGLDQQSVSNGAIYVDLDLDGDQDLVVNNLNEPALVMRNNTNNSAANRFIKVGLSGNGRNTGAIGAKVYLYSDSLVQVQENFPTRGFQSSALQPLIFGTGREITVRQLLVQWPDGTYSKVKNVKTDTTITITQLATAFDSVSHVTEKVKPFLDVTHSSTLDYKHTENNFIDYKLQYLLPYQLSRNGPCLATADVNADGKDDLFTGGAAGQSAELFLSQPDNRFTKYSDAPWKKDRSSEDTDAVFFDADGDGDEDLYVVSGGTEFSPETSQWLQDRLYLNEGGRFRKEEQALPKEKSNGSCVAASDFDHDGDIDLFIGGRSLPGYFPLPAYSHLLRNDSENGTVKFTDVTPPHLKKPGMITSVLWADLNNDTWQELVIAGEFMPLLIYDNLNGTLNPGVDEALNKTSAGLWSKIIATDVDSDGDLDILGGNAGLNTSFHASIARPLTMTYHDFNEDGSIDPILSFYIKGEPNVYNSRDEILEQLPHLKKKFLKYADYASAKLSDILSIDQLKKAKILQVVQLESAIFLNDGKDGFQTIPLPVEAQFSNVTSFIMDDFNNDTFKDILIAGNFFPYRVQMGRSDAASGVLLQGNGTGKFTTAMSSESGFYADGDVRSMVGLQMGNDRYVVVGNNDGPLKIFKINSDKNAFLTKN